MRDDDDRPVPTREIRHVIGERLDDLSVRDFDERIALLKAEIERLQQARDIKQAAKGAAASVFRL